SLGRQSALILIDSAGCLRWSLSAVRSGHAASAGGCDRSRMRPSADISSRYLLRWTAPTCYTSSVILGLGVSAMRRREFIALLGSGVAGWPLAVRAQQPGKTPRVGYIRAGTPRNDPFREEFVRGMRDLGYVEGRNIAYEFRHYGDDVESIP